MFITRFKYLSHQTLVALVVLNCCTVFMTLFNVFHMPVKISGCSIEPNRQAIQEFRKNQSTICTPDPHNDK